MSALTDFLLLTTVLLCTAPAETLTRQSGPGRLSLLDVTGCCVKLLRALGYRGFRALGAWGLGFEGLSQV